MDWIYVVLIVCVVISVCALGIAIRVVFIDNKDRQKLKAEKQALKAELDQFADEALDEQQRCEQVVSALPDLPSWIVRKVDRLKGDGDSRFQEAERYWRDASYHAKCISMSSARDQLDYAREKLALARETVDKLTAIPGEIEQSSADADWKSIEALSRVEQVQELGKAMSDQGIVLNAAVFDTLQSVADELEAMIDANGEGADDRSDQILARSEKLLAHAETLKHSLEYLAAVRAYVPKRIAEHRHRPDDLMGRNDAAIRTLEHIKSFSAPHVWYGLDQQLKDVPGMLRQAGLSFSLASEMYAAQGWFAAKTEVEEAVALTDESERIFDEVAVLDAKIVRAKNGSSKALREATLAIFSAASVVNDPRVGIEAKQLVLSAQLALSRASRLVRELTDCDYIGAVEALGQARQFAEAAIDRAKLDTGPEIDVVIQSREHDDAEAAELAPAADCVGDCWSGPRGGGGAGISG